MCVIFPQDKSWGILTQIIMNTQQMLDIIQQRQESGFETQSISEIGLLHRLIAVFQKGAAQLNDQKFKSFCQNIFIKQLANFKFITRDDFNNLNTKDQSRYQPRLKLVLKVINNFCELNAGLKSGYTDQPFEKRTLPSALVNSFLTEIQVHQQETAILIKIATPFYKQTQKNLQHQHEVKNVQKSENNSASIQPTRQTKPTKHKQIAKQIKVQQQVAHQPLPIRPGTLAAKYLDITTPPINNTKLGSQPIYRLNPDFQANLTPNKAYRSATVKLYGHLVYDYYQSFKQKFMQTQVASTSALNHFFNTYQDSRYGLPLWVVVDALGLVAMLAPDKEYDQLSAIVSGKLIERLAGNGQKGRGLSYASNAKTIENLKKCADDGVSKRPFTPEIIFWYYLYRWAVIKTAQEKHQESAILTAKERTFSPEVQYVVNMLKKLNQKIDSQASQSDSKSIANLGRMQKQQYDQLMQLLSKNYGITTMSAGELMLINHKTQMGFDEYGQMSPEGRQRFIQYLQGNPELTSTTSAIRTTGANEAKQIQKFEQTERNHPSRG